MLFQFSNYMALIGKGIAMVMCKCNYIVHQKYVNHSRGLEQIQWRCSQECTYVKRKNVTNHLAHPPVTGVPAISDILVHN